jgi:hypothetical protein
MKKLITFGCSFTNYAWLTWSDIIAMDRDCEYENWALGGGGNQQIARRALYRSLRGLESGDWVMIQWSSITREDRFRHNDWVAQGSVALSSHYGAEFVNKYWDWNNDVINTAHSRLTTAELLKGHLKYEMAMPWSDQGMENQGYYNSDLTKFWQQHVPRVDEISNNARPFNGKTRDGHPDPSQWLAWVEDRIYPKFGWQLKQSTKHTVTRLQNYLESLLIKGASQSDLQHLGSVWVNQQGIRTMKVRPGSDTLGHDVRILM